MSVQKRLFVIMVILAACLIMIPVVTSFAAENDDMELSFAALSVQEDLEGLMSLPISLGSSETVYSIEVEEDDLYGYESVQLLLVTMNGAQYLSNQNIGEAGVYLIPREINEEYVVGAYFINFFAKAARLYEVAFLGFDGNTVLAAQYIEEGGAIDLNAIPIVEVAENDTLLGWYLAESGNPFNLETPIDRDYRLMPWVGQQGQQVFSLTFNYIDAEGIEIDEPYTIDDLMENEEVDFSDFQEIDGLVLESVSFASFNSLKRLDMDHYTGLMPAGDVIAVLHYVEPEVLAAAPAASNLQLTTDANLVKAGDYFRLYPAFKEAVNSNTAVLTFTFDKTKFEYRGFTPAEEVSSLAIEETDSGVRITIMRQSYGTTEYGEILMSAREDAKLKDELNEISVSVDYVLLLEDGTKTVKNEVANVTFTTTGEEEENPYTLLNLSDLIDAFGMTKDHEEWAKFMFYDFNNNGMIDVQDISVFSSKL